MKANIINKLILIIALLTAVPTLHAADPTAVSSKVKWIFGSNPTITDASFEKACTIKDRDNQPLGVIPTGSGVEYIIENLKLYRNGNATNLVKQYEDRLYNYKSLRFVFKVSSATSGTLTLGARKWADSKNEDKSIDDGRSDGAIDFSVSVDNGSAQTLSIAKDATSGSLNITGLCDGSTIEIYSSTTASYYYILWEPGAATPATPVTPTIKTSTGADVSTFTGTALGLTTDSSVDLSDKFKVVNSSADVTDKGTFSYTATSPLSVSGTTLSASETTNSGSLTVTWTPTTENLSNYNEVQTQITGITVTAPKVKENLTMTITTDNGKVLEIKGDDGNKQKSQITVTYKKSDDTVVEGLTTTFSTSESSIITLGNAGLVTAKAKGQATVTASFAGNGDYNPVSGTIKFTIPESATLPTLKTTQIKKDKNNDISAIGGWALELTTINNADISKNVKVFNSDNSDKTNNGTFSYRSSNMTLDGSKLSSTTTLTNGNLDIVWVPNNCTQLSSDIFQKTVTGKATYDEDNNSLDFEQWETRSWGFFSENESTGRPTGSDKPYAFVEITPVAYSVTLCAQYYLTDDEGNALYDENGDRQYAANHRVNPANSGIIYVPLYPNRKLAQIWIQPHQAGTIFFHNAGIDTSTTVEIPAFASLNDIIVKKGLTATYTPSQPTVKTSATTDIKVTYKDGDTVIDNLTTKFTSSDVNYATVTGGDGVPTGSTTVTGVAIGSIEVNATFEGNETYAPLSLKIPVLVKGKDNFEYMGMALTGDMKGTLKDDVTGDELCHWKFGAPEGSDLYVFKYLRADNKYVFQSDPLVLEDNAQTTENAIDTYSHTKLTKTDGGGDAFTEYNGMIGGYGTENGGRYLTPISGTFIRVEPLYDGVVTIRLRHNGGIDGSAIKEEEVKDATDISAGKYDYTKTTEKDGVTTTKYYRYTNLRCARRPLFVLDENGVVMPRTTNYDYWRDKWDAATDVSDFKPVEGTTGNYTNKIDGTFAVIAKDSKINDRTDIINDKYYTYFNGSEGSLKGSVLGSNNDEKFSKNAFCFTVNKIYGYTDMSKFNTDVKTSNDFVQKLFYSADDDDVTYGANDIGETTQFFSKYGYECLSATHLKISFPVKAGKTYFVGANKSKVGLCTLEFDRMQDTSTLKTYELNEAAETTPYWLKSDGTPGTGQPAVPDDGSRINCTLKREFTPNNWHPLILPFSVSESKLKEVFGDDVKVIALDGSLRILSTVNNYATHDHDKPLGTLINGTVIQKDTDAESAFYSKPVIKQPAVHDDCLTFTRHYYQMIYANCPVFICPSEVNYDKDGSNAINGQITFNNVTFSRPDFNSSDEVVLPFTVDQQIGDTDNGYHFHMVAKYRTTDSESNATEMYFLSNNSGSATIYHAEPHDGPAMKATRVWIQADSDMPAAPIRRISMESFDGESYSAIDDFGTSAIEDIVCDQPLESLAADDNVYDVAGRVVGYGSTDGLNPGLYIYKGRKIYIR